MLLEMFEDLHGRRLDLSNQLKRLEEDEKVDGEEMNRICKSIASLDKILLGDKAETSDHYETSDPLIDKWEREIAEGKVPDLEET